MATVLLPPSIAPRPLHESEPVKAMNTLLAGLNDFTKGMSAIRARQIMQGIKDLPLQLKEKLSEYDSNGSGFVNADAKRTYLLGRLHHYEGLIAAEKEKCELDVLWRKGLILEVLSQELSKLCLPVEQVLRYYLHFSLRFCLKQRLETKAAVEVKPAPSTIAVAVAEPQQLPSPMLPARTREMILQSLQGLPPEQQLVNRKDALIILEVSNSTFYQWQKSGVFPLPVRINGRGKKTLYLLEELLQALTTSRKTSKFKPRW